MRARPFVLLVLVLSTILLVILPGCSPQGGDESPSDGVVNTAPIEDYPAAVRLIQENFPEVAEFTPQLTRQPFAEDWAVVLEDGALWNVVIFHGAGDCAAGCIDNYYWYFQVDPQGKITAVGKYQRVLSGGKQVEAGQPRWGYPR